jgi:hypothetical protein
MLELKLKTSNSDTMIVVVQCNTPMRLHFRYI